MKITLLLIMTTIFTVEPLGALATELTSLSPGVNEIQFKHDGRSRRLIITTPKTFGGQGPYPVLFCFHGAGGKADGPSKRWSAHADKRGLIVISAEAVQPLAKWNFRDKFHAEEHDDVGFVWKGRLGSGLQCLAQRVTSLANKMMHPSRLGAEL